MELPAISGHLSVDERVKGRVYVAKFVTAEGNTTRRVLGPAHVRDPGTRTSRNAVSWRAGHGVKPEGHLNPKDADERLAALLAEEKEKRRRSGGARGDSRGRTLSDVLASFIEDRTREGRSSSTLRGYRSLARLIEGDLGQTTALRKIDVARVKTYRAELLDRPGLSHATIERRWHVFRAAMEHARKAGWIALNPVADVDRPPRPQLSGNFVLRPLEEIEAIARAAEGGGAPVGPNARKAASPERIKAYNAERVRKAKQVAAIIRVAAHSGLRLGELRGLRWEDIDFRLGLIHVRRNIPSGATEKAPKSGRVRHVQATDVAMRALDDLSRREAYVSPEDFVFPSASGGPFDDARLRKDFYAAIDAAGLSHLREARNGLRGLTLHDLRHVYASIAARGSGDLVKVKQLMGHADIGTTMRYVHLIEDPDLRRKLNEAFSGGRDGVVAADAVTTGDGALR